MTTIGTRIRCSIPMRRSLPCLLLLLGGCFVERVFSFCPLSSTASAWRQSQSSLLAGVSSIGDPTDQVAAESSTGGRKKTAKQAPPKQRECKCSICGMSFLSRNALFSHLKTTDSCAAKAGFDIVKGQELQSCRVALLVAYDSNDATTSAEVFGKHIRRAFNYGLATKYHDTSTDSSTSTTSDDIKIISSSHVTVPKLRHISLAQEAGCSATGDVLILGYNSPAFSPSLSMIDRDNLRRQHMKEVIETANTQLEKLRPENHIDILSFRLFDNDALNAERGCTQRVYHYLLPLKWLPGGDAVSKWWLEQHKSPNRGKARRKTFGGVGGGEFRAKQPPPEPTLRLLKDILRQAESKDATKDNKRIASGRFGALGYNERKCWHNFAASKLQGLASPSNEPVWKCLDRARIVEFFPHGEDQEVVLVLEFRGEDFVEESVRRIMGAAVAMTHGWLPENFLDLATQPDSLIETPLAPEGRLYFAGARFHFDELARGGASLFDSGDDILAAKGVELRQRMLDRLKFEGVQDEANWLEELQHVTCPRIRSNIHEPKSSDALESAPIRDSPAPPEYQQTLDLLRGIISSSRWPETSAARSKVIRQESIEGGQNNMSGGSFTVVNPAFQDGILFNDCNSFVPPRANKLFPDLAAAVFELESRLAPNRLPSSHCAVNRRAQFLPHVDSGRGAGQSVSMIVGLGNYVGGETVVESTPHDIRYNPLEFDGWKERHWTSAYCGERFSLVWFTPEMEL
jgi:tRNA U38,U39,U40 pseudouridine synthase TruA